MHLAAFAAVLLFGGAFAVPTSVKTRRQVPSSFVTTSGTDFVLDGKKFAFLGANSYWLPLLVTHDDVDTTFAGMQGHGVKVVRTWGFNAINSTELSNATATNLTYYQTWYTNGTYTLNDGPQGLERLDYVVNTAGKYGIRIILAFTNDWIGYGGMDLYLSNILGSNATQDEFYTNPTVIASYQSYVKTIVERYKDSPNVFAWEIANEARCLGQLLAGPSCVPGSYTLYNWYKQTSDYIRSLDPYHLITTGGEGQFYWAQPEYYWYNNTYTSDYNYNGQAGEYFDQNLMSLDNIDFGVYHMYPESWYPELNFPGSNFSIPDWGVEWIQQHADSAHQANKPIVLEEFGVGTYQNKTDWYPIWTQKALDTNHAGIIPWQYGQLGLTEDGGNRIIKYEDEILNGASPNDGNTYYSNQTEVWDIFQKVGEVQNSRSV